LYLGIGQVELALIDLNVALALDPNNAEAHFRRGLIYTALEQPHNAITDYEAALNGGLSYTALFVQLGMAYASIGEADTALRLLDIAIQQEAENPQAHYARGLVLLLQGLSYSASVEATIALSLKPDYVEALGLRGTAYLNTRAWEAAIVDFQSAYALDPAYVDALYGIAQAQVGLGRTDAAVATLQQYLQQAPAGARNRAAAEALLAAILVGTTPQPTSTP
jgi:tetratricopeptide (TPR) repeat protein